MTWPPNNQPTGGKSDSTPMATDHPTEHNAIKATLDDIIAENAGALPLTGGTVTGELEVADNNLVVKAYDQRGLVLDRRANANVPGLVQFMPSYEAGSTAGDIKVDGNGVARFRGDKFSRFYGDLKVDGQTLAQNGTKSKPAYSFASDTNTGIRQSHTNAIEIVGNGKRLLQIGIDAGSTETGAWMPTISTRTTNAPANVWIHTDAAQEGALFRSTASRAYMQEVEAVNFEATNSVYDLEPIWFRSTCDGDNIEHSHYGLAAEDCAAVDPRLAIMATDENGVETADHVNTNAVIALLVSAVKSQRETIASLTARVEALET